MSQRPPSISYRTGDATAPLSPPPLLIAHVCNDIGRWGRGFAAALSARWPVLRPAFRAWYQDRASNDFALGAVQFVEVAPGLWVANMVGQRGILRKNRSDAPVRYDALLTALQTTADFAQARQASVQMPRIGAGLAGGDWDQIVPLIEQTLLSAGIPTTVCDLR